MLQGCWAGLGGKLQLGHEITGCGGGLTAVGNAGGEALQLCFPHEAPGDSIRTQTVSQ